METSPAYDLSPGDIIAIRDHTGTEHTVTVYWATYDEEWTTIHAKETSYKFVVAPGESCRVISRATR